MTRVTDTIILLVGFTLFITIVVYPPAAWGIGIFVLLAFTFGGDA